jgi:hypothetical protein
VIDMIFQSHAVNEDLAAIPQALLMLLSISGHKSPLVESIGCDNREISRGLGPLMLEKSTSQTLPFPAPSTKCSIGDGLIIVK